MGSFSDDPANNSHFGKFKMKTISFLTPKNHIISNNPNSPTNGIPSHFPNGIIDEVTSKIKPTQKIVKGIVKGDPINVPQKAS